MRRFKLFLIALFVIIAVWVGLDFLCFHGVKTDANLKEVSIGLPRLSATGFRVRPIQRVYCWGLTSNHAREASHDISRFIDKQHIDQLLAGVWGGYYQCTLRIEGGFIQQGWQEGIIAPLSQEVRDYITGVIQSFSGEFSAWARVELRVGIDFDSGEIRLSCLSFEMDPLFMAPSVEVAGVAGCPIGQFGSIEYKEGLCSADQIIASRGFNVVFQ